MEGTEPIAPVAEQARSVDEPRRRRRRGRRRRRRRRYIQIAVVLIAALVIMTGFVHIVHGGGDGCCHVCRKEAWSIGDTFVDLDDYIGKSILQNLDRARVLRAMEDCGMLTREPTPPRRGLSEECLNHPTVENCER